MRRRWTKAIAIAGAGALVIAMTEGNPSTAAANATRATAALAGSVRPNGTGMLDCNGHSPLYRDAKKDLGGLCTDPLDVWSDGTSYRFTDNGSYVGHDEPSVKFISSQPGSGNDMTYVVKLPTDPTARPTVPGGSGNNVSDYAELSVAPWFGLPICDPQSYPQNPCKPDSDTNIGSISAPNAAGSAFMELQLYPPGFTPFADAPSCNQTSWCAALTIDSLEGTFGFQQLNANCEEPVNFAFLQRNGVPAGPPSPQLADQSTFTPNRQTLMMHPGDVIVVTIHDTPNGLLTVITDLSTGQIGYMVASAANGFMNTNLTTCDGTPFDFHAEYSTAKQQNQVPWAALEGGVLMEQEIGHFEACSSVTNSSPVSATYPNGQSFSDPNVYQTCIGGSEGAGKVGQGPCNVTTGTCQNATTVGGAACANNNFTSGNLCEYSDADCMPAGPRPVSVNGVAQVSDWPIAGCQDASFQNGDLDFDGTPYIADWPNGSPNHPTSFAYVGPFTRGLHTYPQVQFETDVAGSEANCNINTGAGCTAPPQGAAFYPFWTLGSSGALGCSWQFGNVIPGQTRASFGGDAQYGSADIARFGGTLASAVMQNPQLSCGLGLNAAVAHA